MPPVSNQRSQENNNSTPLPKIFGEDKRIKNPQEAFKLSDRYKFVRLIGHGAYGMVCAAMDEKQNSTIAIKRINQLNSLLVAKRTLRELKLLSHFKGHPNIIQIQSIFLHDNDSEQYFEEIYVSQELMDADLCHIIQSKYSLSESQCKRLLYKLLKGVKSLHDANVIHRDLKPGNILWKQNGELKICDFGLARGVREDETTSKESGVSELAMTNYVATRWYRPPEILLYKKNYGKSLDIWSVGCIFAELLGRKVLLPGQSGFEQLHLILQKLGTPSDKEIENIPSEKSRNYLKRLPKYKRFPLKKRFPNASDDAIDLLDKMLAFDPEKRITVEGALAHIYFNDIKSTENQEECSKVKFNFDFDAECINVEKIKGMILDELKKYNGLEAV